MVHSCTKVGSLGTKTRSSRKPDNSWQQCQTKKRHRPVQFPRPGRDMFGKILAHFTTDALNPPGETRSLLVQRECVFERTIHKGEGGTRSPFVCEGHTRCMRARRCTLRCRKCGDLTNHSSHRGNTPSPAKLRISHHKLHRFYGRPHDAPPTTR